MITFFQIFRTATFALCYHVWGDWKRETWHRETCFSVRV